jgi:hypothetical protein
MKPGRAFWVAFTAFFATEITLLGLDKIAPDLDLTRIAGATFASVVVAAFMYGREKLSQGQQPQDQDHRT